MTWSPLPATPPYSRDGTCAIVMWLPTWESCDCDFQAGLGTPGVTRTPASLGRFSARDPRFLSPTCNKGETENQDENYFCRFPVGTGVTTSSIDNPRAARSARTAETANKYTVRSENTRRKCGTRFTIPVFFFSFFTRPFRYSVEVHSRRIMFIDDPLCRSQNINSHHHVFRLGQLDDPVRVPQKRVSRMFTSKFLLNSWND